MKTRLHPMRRLASASLFIGLVSLFGTAANAQQLKIKPEAEAAAAAAQAASATGKGKVNKAAMKNGAVAGTTTPSNGSTECTNSPGHIQPGLPRCPEGVIGKNPGAAATPKK